MKLKSKTLAMLVIVVCIYIISLCVRVSCISLNPYIKVTLVCVAIICVCCLLYKAYKILV